MIGVIVVLVIVLVLLGAFAYLGAQLGPLVSKTQLTDVTVGQCFNGGRAPVATSVQVVFGVDVVDCSEPHTSELMATFDYPSDAGPNDYPGLELVSAYARDQCIDRFASYVGLSFDQSALDLTYIYPQDGNWSLGDRSIQCIVHPLAGEETSTGSFRNARR